MKTKNDKKSFTFSFSMKILATREKEQSIWEKTNQRAQTKCKFHNCSFYKTHNPLHENEGFYECRKETKCTKSIKTNSFYFWEMKNLNNNFYFEGKLRILIKISPIKKRRIKRKFPFQKQMDLMQK